MARPGVREVSAPSHTRFAHWLCERLAQAAEMLHDLLLLRACALPCSQWDGHLISIGIH